MNYKLRAECLHDVNALMAIIPFKEFPVIVEVDASNQVIDVDCQYAPSYLCDWPLDEFQNMYERQYPENAKTLLKHDLEQDQNSRLRDATGYPNVHN